jgi:hypothetical protein
MCYVSVFKVSNWFGNKRIRFKKNIGKGQEEANMYSGHSSMGGPGTPSGSGALSPGQQSNTSANDDSLGSPGLDLPGTGLSSI